MGISHAKAQRRKEADRTLRFLCAFASLREKNLLLTHTPQAHNMRTLSKGIISVVLVHTYSISFSIFGLPSLSTRSLHYPWMMFRSGPQTGEFNYGHPAASPRKDRSSSRSHRFHRIRDLQLPENSTGKYKRDTSGRRVAGANTIAMAAGIPANDALAGHQRKYSPASCHKRKSVHAAGRTTLFR
jgi:hypothetical protein